MVWEPPDDAVGNGFTIIVYVAVATGIHAGVNELVTVIVNITCDPASEAEAVYVGVVVPCPFVIVPAPLWVQKMVPFAALAPFTVAEPLEQIVWEPPAVADGNGFTNIVYIAVAAGEQTGVKELVIVIVKVTVLLASPKAAV